MNTAYSTARKNGLFPPFAACAAAWQTSPSLAAQIRSLHPSGAALLFAAAYVAGLAGSLAAPLIVAAFLVGLYLVKVQPIVAKTFTVPTTIAGPTVAAVPVAIPAAPVSQFPGMVVSRVTLAAPSANGKAPKVAVNQ